MDLVGNTMVGTIHFSKQAEEIIRRNMEQGLLKIKIYETHNTTEEGNCRNAKTLSDWIYTLIR